MKDSYNSRERIMTSDEWFSSVENLFFALVPAVTRTLKEQS